MPHIPSVTSWGVRTALQTHGPFHSCSQPVPETHGAIQRQHTAQSRRLVLRFLATSQDTRMTGKLLPLTQLGRQVKLGEDSKMTGVLAIGLVMHGVYSEAYQGSLWRTRAQR